MRIKFAKLSVARLIFVMYRISNNHTNVIYMCVCVFVDVYVCVLYWYGYVCVNMISIKPQKRECPPYSLIGQQEISYLVTKYIVVLSIVSILSHSNHGIMKIGTWLEIDLQGKNLSIISAQTMRKSGWLCCYGDNHAAKYKMINTSGSTIK